MSIFKDPLIGVREPLVLICGDRWWQDAECIADRLRKLPAYTRIIHGNARGADKIAGCIAELMGFSVEAIEADWDKYGKRAGPIRNRVMLDRKPNLVIAFHPDIGNSKGTKDCITEADRRGISTETITG